MGKTMLHSEVWDGKCETHIRIVVKGDKQDARVFDLEGQALMGAMVSDNGDGTMDGQAFIVGAGIEDSLKGLELIIDLVDGQLKRVEDKNLRNLLRMSLSSKLMLRADGMVEDIIS